MRKTKFRMDSIIASYFIFTGAIITAFGSCWFALSSKKENDLSFKKVSQDQEMHAKESMDKITERTETVLNDIDSMAINLNRTLVEKYDATFDNIGMLNRQIESTRNQLSNQVKSLSSPLHPFKIRISFIIDYKNVPIEVKESINRFKSYFEEFPDYKKVIQTHREIILHYQNADYTGDVTVICNRGFEYNYDYEPPGGLGLKQGMILNTFFPNIAIGFNGGESTIQPIFGADLMYDFNPSPNRGNPNLMDYRIFIQEEKIRFNVSVEAPYLSETNGHIISLNDCNEGNIFIRFHHTIGEIVHLESLSLGLGIEYKNVIRLPMNKTPLVQDPIDSSRTYFYVDLTRLKI